MNLARKVHACVLAGAVLVQPVTAFADFGPAQGGSGSGGGGATTSNLSTVLGNTPNPGQTGGHNIVLSGATDQLANTGSNTLTINDATGNGIFFKSGLINYGAFESTGLFVTNSLLLGAGGDGQLTRVGAGTLKFSDGVTNYAKLGSGGLNLQAAGSLGWSSTTDATAAADTTITRAGAGLTTISGTLANGFIEASVSNPTAGTGAGAEINAVADSSLAASLGVTSSTYSTSGSGSANQNSQGIVSCSAACTHGLAIYNGNSSGPIIISVNGNGSNNYRGNWAFVAASNIGDLRGLSTQAISWTSSASDPTAAAQTTITQGSVAGVLSVSGASANAALLLNGTSAHAAYLTVDGNGGFDIGTSSGDTSGQIFLTNETLFGTLTLTGATISGSPSCTLGATTFTGNVTLSTHNLITDTSTGTIIGTATNQKISFWNASPTTQIAGSTDVLAGLVTVGLRAASSNPPLNLGTGSVTAGASTFSGTINWATGGSYAVGATSELYGPTDTGLFISAGKPAATNPGQQLTLSGGLGNAAGGGLATVSGGAAGAGSNLGCGGLLLETGTSSTGNAVDGGMTFKGVPCVSGGASGSGTNNPSTLLQLNAVQNNPGLNNSSTYYLAQLGSVTFGDGGTSNSNSQQSYCFGITPTINYTGATKSELFTAFFTNLTYTSAPTGNVNLFDFQVSGSSFVRCNVTSSTAATLDLAPGISGSLATTQNLSRTFGPNGFVVTRGVLRNSVTTSSGTSVALTTSVPAGATIVAVAYRITTTVTGPTGNVQLQDNGGSVYLSQGTLTSGTTIVGGPYGASSSITGSGNFYAASNQFKLVSTATSFSAGVIEVIIVYDAVTAPAS